MNYESVAMATDNDEIERLRGVLRAVLLPGSQRNIVAVGFVKDIEVAGARVTVHFAPNTRNRAKVEQMEADIKDTLSAEGHFEQIEVRRYQPFADAGTLSTGGMAPPQADRDDDGPAQRNGPAQKNGAQASDLRRPDMAPQAGYDEDGPAPLGGPRSDIYEGELPVFQWQIDPHDANAKSGTANLQIGDWEFRVWWQVHPAGLVYASIQAMRDDWVDHDGDARSHPVGRSDAVNLVYDTDRKAVVAIYGTVQDFRPFVDAFHRGYVLKN
jgi:metal-sulfur cluster biosynthetic enzyme